MLKKRIVATGLGIVSSIGLSVEEFWKNLLNGKSGIEKISSFYESIQDSYPKYFGFLKDSEYKYRTKNIGLVKNIERFVSDIESFKKAYSYTGPVNIAMPEWRRIGLFEKFAIGAACEALLEAKMLSGFELTYAKDRVAICIGNGIGGLDIIDSAIEDTSQYLSGSLAKLEPKPNTHLMKYGPMYIISTIPNLCASYISMAYNLEGPNYVVNAACASANMAICNAADMIRNSRADIVLCGGSERSMGRSGIAGFDAMTALSRSDDPKKASKPYHIDRDGFICADGAGILVLEELEHALERRASLKEKGIDLKIYCELLDYGITSDAHHISKPSEKGMIKAMQEAINHSGVKESDIAHVTTHATSTPIGDECELSCIRKVLDSNGEHNFEKCIISAIKSSIGHTLGASAALQSIALAKSFEEGVVPPILNMEPEKSIDPKANYAMLGHSNKFDNTKCIMSNSFGFGGSNVVCIWKGYKE